MFNWIKYYKRGLLALGIFLSTSMLYNAQDVAEEAPEATQNTQEATDDSSSAGIELKGDPEKGADLFKQNCTACHTLDQKLVGPPLGGIVEKITQDGQSMEWIHQWIKNSQALVKSGDPYAKKIFEENGSVVMTPFPNLSEADIDDILAYTSNPPDEAASAAEDQANQQIAEQIAKKNAVDNTSIAVIDGFIILFLAFVALLTLIYVRVRKLENLSKTPEELSKEKSNKILSLNNIYEKYKLVGQGIIVVLVFLAGYGIWNWLMWIGVYKGYKPEQPIHFSHKIHAGINKMDCQLCHSGAKYGKVSEIPSLNVCMNCHKAIPEYKGEYLEPGRDRDFYTGEIQKLYSAVGWDPATMTYSGETHPVEWIRIHNMPDFVYFNHSQHVVAGEKAIIEGFNKKNPNDKIDVVCKACHGKIDTMNVVQMANDFTMGWCIDCHRTTEVDMDNTYNQAYFEKLHDKLKKDYGTGAKITVDAIGGIECGKCHY